MGARTAAAETVCGGSSGAEESIEGLRFPAKTCTVVFVLLSVCSEHRSSPPPPPGPRQAAARLFPERLAHGLWETGPGLQVPEPRALKAGYS